MKDRIREILSKVARLPSSVSDIGVDDDLYAAGLSSLASVNVMLAIEEEFDIEFSDELLTRRSFQSISSLTSVVMKLSSRPVSS